MSQEIANATVDVFVYGGEDRDVNLVEAIQDLAMKTNRIAKAITPQDASAGYDATGGTITSLTEAVMGMTGGLVQIASAIQSLAESIQARE